MNILGRILGGRASPSAKFTGKPFPVGYSLTEFRANDALSASMESFLKHGLGPQMLAVLHNEAPHGYPLRGQTIDGVSAALELGRIEGYKDAIAVIYAMGIPLPLTRHIEPDYGEDATFKKEFE